MYFSETVRREYRDRHSNHDNVIKLNDVVFSLHALFAASVITLQVLCYRKTQHKPSQTLKISLMLLGVVLFIATAAKVSNNIDWLDLLYLLSGIKVVGSLIKYIPQLLFNYRRKSTKGWSIINILLDFSGGILSLLQMILDTAIEGDLSALSGNLPKILLGLTSILFDVLFMIQHYFLYHRAEEGRFEVLNDDDSTKSKSLSV